LKPDQNSEDDSVNPINTELGTFSGRLPGFFIVWTTSKPGVPVFLVSIIGWFLRHILFVFLLFSI
jgi:hypothetical protein